MTTAKIRTVRLVGPQLSPEIGATPAKYLWVADLSTDLRRKLQSQGGFVANPSLRVLTQSAEARQSYVIRKDANETVALYDPLMFQLAVRGNPEYGGTLRFVADVEGQNALASSISVAAFPAAPQSFSQVVATTLAPGGRWPDKSSSHIETAPLSLTLGTVEVAVRNESGLGDIWECWSIGGKKQIGADSYVPILGGAVYVKVEHGAFPYIVNVSTGKESKWETRIDSASAVDRIVLSLTPNGVEFDAVIDDPFGTAKRISVRLRIEPDGAGGQRLVLLKEISTSDLRPALDGLVEAVRSERLPLVFSVRPGVIPLIWRLVQAGNRLTLRDGIKRPMMAPGTVRATFSTEPVPGAILPTTATLIDPGLMIDSTNPDARVLTVEAGELPGESMALSVVDLFKVKGKAAFQVGFGLRKGAAATTALPVIVERDRLAADLELRYQRQGLRRDNDSRALFSFIALERGVLQVPLPPKPQELPSSVRLKEGIQAFFGLAFIRLLQDNQKDINKPAVHVGDVTVDSASFVRIIVQFIGSIPASTDIALSGVRGVISGALWFANATPTAEEIVPMLNNGPIALSSTLLSFGRSSNPQCDWTGEIGPLNVLTSVPALKLKLNVEVRKDAPVVHWAPMVGMTMPLVAGMNMTRTASNAQVPSRTRDLVPVFHEIPTDSDSDSATSMVTLGLQAFGLTLPVASVASNTAKPRFGWPQMNDEWKSRQGSPSSDVEPKEGVAFSVLTLPGVEVVPKTTDVATPQLDFSLRYDLPILGELFAEANLTQAVTGPVPASRAPQTTALDLQALKAFWYSATRQLALTRTQRDRVTGWGTADAIGLIEPFTWASGFQVDSAASDILSLPFGRYSLNSGASGAPQWVAGEEALAGLKETFKPNGKMLSVGDWYAVTGFALAPYDVTLDQTGVTDSPGSSIAVSDTRGFVMGKVAQSSHGCSVRKSALRTSHDKKLDKLTDLLTTTSPLKLELHGRTLELWLRDLPVMPLAAGGWTFVADETPESALGPDSKVFDRTRLPKSVYEWRLFDSEAGRQRPPPHEIAIGPLTLRPLRLWGLVADTNANLTSADVLFGIGAPRVVAAVSASAQLSEPFGPEALYETGNTVLIRFEWDQGKFQAKRISDAEVKKSAITVNEGANKASLTLQLEVNVKLGDEAQSSRLRAVTMSFQIQIVGGQVTGFANNAELDMLLLGAPTTMHNGTVQISAKGVTVVFKGAAPIPGHVTIKTATLMITDSGCELTIEGEATLDDLVGEPREAIKIALGKNILWYGATISSTNAPDTLVTNVDHDRGVLTVELRQATCSGSWVRGFSMDNTNAQGLIVIVAQPPDKELPMVWRITTARFDVSTSRADGTLKIAQLTRLPRVDNEAATTIRVTVPSPHGGRRSTVAWPVGRLGKQLEEFLGPLKPYLGETKSLYTVKLRATGTTLIHYVQPRLVDLALDASLIDKSKGGWRLFGIWRAKVLTEHTLDGDGLIVCFSTLDDVAIVDLANVAARLANPNDELSREYGFLPRYVHNGSKETEPLPIAGIGRVGLFGRDIDRILINASAGGVDETLAIFGGAIVEASLDGEDSNSVIFPLPWIASLVGGSVAPLLNIAQAPPLGQQVEISPVAAFDLASAIPTRQIGLSPVTIGLGPGTAIDVRQTLIRVFGIEAAKARQVVDQAFAANLYPNTDTNAAFIQPLFWRALMALTRLWSDCKVERPQIKTLLARPDRGDAVRVQIGRAMAEQQADSFTGGSDLLVVGRSQIGLIPVPPGTRSDEGDSLAHLTAFASTQVAEPLALFVVTIADPEWMDLPPERRSHGSVRPIALAAAYELRRMCGLRDMTRTIHPSAALGWPNPPPNTPWLLNLGDERVIQDQSHAWAGRARVIGGPSDSKKGESVATFAQGMDFLSIGRRVLFARGGDQAPNVVSPPDRALIPAASRVRLPLGAEILSALSKNLNETSTLQSDDPSPLAALSPGRFEVFSSGVRAGVLAMEYEGFLRAQTDIPFDPEHSRFGRPADRMPMVWRQGRSPRNAALPRGRTLVDSRRTFVGENLFVNEKNSITGDETHELQPLVVFAGPGAVLRYAPTQLGETLDSTIALLLTVQVPDKGWLGQDWAGKITIKVRRPEGIKLDSDLTQTLAMLGLLSKGLQATLRIGSTVAVFAVLTADLLVGDHISFDLLMTVSEVDRIRAAIQSADADTSSLLTLRLAPIDKNASPPPSPIVLSQTGAAANELPEGVPLTVTVPLLLLPVNRPWRAVEVATVVFGDPAYDRELASPARSTTKVGSDHITYLLALDRAEYDLAQTIYFAFGAINPAFLLPQSDDSPFGEPKGAWPIAITLSPKKPTQSGKTRALTVSGQALAQSAVGHSGKTFAIPIAALVETNGKPAILFPGDRLSITVQPLDIKGAPLEFMLSIDAAIVTYPVIAPPAVIYGVVTHDDHAATPVLFASAPQASLIEFPDLLSDLVRGHVRRRALFVWPFVPRAPILPGERKAGLVKVDRTGGGQIPGLWKVDFPPAEGDL